MDCEIIESELLSIATMCVNDFCFDKKDILLVGVKNEHLLRLLSSFNVNIYAINSHIKNANFSSNVAFYDLAIQLKVNQFDVIIDLQNSSVQHYKKLLKNNGILIVDLKALESNEILAKNANFNIIMPFKIHEKNIEKYYLFVSNKFHPIADLSLQKLDLLENLQYYNERTYTAAYAIPNYIKKSLQGVVRN